MALQKSHQTRQNINVAGAHWQEAGIYIDLKHPDGPRLIDYWEGYKDAASLAAGAEPIGELQQEFTGAALQTLLDWLQPRTQTAARAQGGILSSATEVSDAAWPNQGGA